MIHEVLKLGIPEEPSVALVEGSLVACDGHSLTKIKNFPCMCGLHTILINAFFGRREIQQLGFSYMGRVVAEVYQKISNGYHFLFGLKKHKNKTKIQHEKKRAKAPTPSNRSLGLGGFREKKSFPKERWFQFIFEGCKF